MSLFRFFYSLNIRILRRARFLKSCVFIVVLSVFLGNCDVSIGSLFCRSRIFSCGSLVFRHNCEVNHDRLLFSPFT
ncbi:hypothetical protein ACHAXS_004627 [Conticribra weissflogii]